MGPEETNNVQPEGEEKPDAPESQVSRRDFTGGLLGLLGVGALGFIVYPAVSFLIPPKIREAVVSQVNVGPKTDLPKNSGKLFKFGRKPGILIHTPGGEIRAFEGTCTHLDCNVQYREDLQLIWCACHDGRYDLHGNNVSGPPPRPLKSYRVTESADGDLFVSREKEA